MTTFVDTSVLFASVHLNDQAHEAARRIVESMPSGEAITSDHVVLECWTLLRNRQGRQTANRFWRGLRFAPLAIECIEAVDLERALSIGEHWSDQDFSFVDCTSFAVMERLGCARAASFDPDFAIYRYGPDRTRAFEVLR